MKGLIFQCRSPRTHSRCTHIPSTKNGGNDNLHFSSKFVAFPCQFGGFCPPLSLTSLLLLLQLLPPRAPASSPHKPPNHAHSGGHTRRSTSFTTLIIRFCVPVDLFWLLLLFDLFWCLGPSLVSPHSPPPIIHSLPRQTYGCLDTRPSEFDQIVRYLDALWA